MAFELGITEGEERMKINTHTQQIRVSIVDALNLDEREAAFLRVMAQHCITSNMAGHGACTKLIDILDRCRIKIYDGGPIYGLFEQS